jgi:hypothetical protein
MEPHTRAGVETPDSKKMFDILANCAHDLKTVISIFKSQNNCNF